jgi:hypothetical protein
MGAGGSRRRAKEDHPRRYYVFTAESNERRLGP